ncbi:MAG TPA: hypothetical protein VL947_14295, partial [Cytophagales bacterium]|nr:hypothetical protein [Cytophagales bacterium]
CDKVDSKTQQGIQLTKDTISTLEQPQPTKDSIVVDSVAMGTFCYMPPCAVKPTVMADLAKLYALPDTTAQVLRLLRRGTSCNIRKKGVKQSYIKTKEGKLHMTTPTYKNNKPIQLPNNQVWFEVETEGLVGYLQGHELSHYSLEDQEGEYAYYMHVNEYYDPEIQIVKYDKSGPKVCGYFFCSLRWVRC